MPRAPLPPVPNEQITTAISRVLGTFVADGRLRHDEADGVRASVMARVLERFERGEEIGDVDDYVTRMTVDAANDVIRTRPADAVQPATSRVEEAVPIDVPQPAEPVPTPEPRSRRTLWLAAAALVLLAVLSFWFTRDDPASSPSSQPEGAAAAPRMIRDGAVTITVDDDGQVVSVTSPRAEWTALLTAALRAGKLPPRYDARALAPPVPVRRGEEERVVVHLLQPVGVVVEYERPFFRWSGVPEAFYRVAVMQDGKQVAKSELQSGRMWIPRAPLARGLIYEWQVSALIGKTESTYPPPDQPPARFRIISAAEFEELEAARKTGSRLLTDLIAARLGLGEISVREIDRMLTSASPHPR